MRDLKPITNVVSRRNTLCKRKKCLIKKAMELSKLADVDIYLCVMDRKRNTPKISQYSSTREFTEEVKKLLVKPGDYRIGRTWTNADYAEKYKNQGNYWEMVSDGEDPDDLPEQMEKSEIPKNLTAPFKIEKIIHKKTDDSEIVTQEQVL